MQHLREEEIEGLSLEMAKMGSVEEETTEAILGELADAARADGIGDVAAASSSRAKCSSARSAPSAPRSCSGASRP